MVVASLAAQHLIALRCTCRHIHDLTDEIANIRTREEFGGVTAIHAACSKVDRIPYWVKLRKALQPATLFNHRGGAPPRTVPVPIVLDTSGTWFLEFEICAAKALNGCPRIGVLDASALATASPSQDLSQTCVDKFAMSFSPICGRLFAVTAQRAGDEGQQFASRTAHLRWAPLGNAYAKMNPPVRAGILINQGVLTFYRVGGHDAWHSSGPLWRDLPAKVVPCMFLSAYLGYGCVRFVALHEGPPWVCPHCDPRGHGTREDWERWPVIGDTSTAVSVWCR